MPQHVGVTLERQEVGLATYWTQQLYIVPGCTNEQNHADWPNPPTTREPSGPGAQRVETYG
jgi:hypothetical protein